MYDGSIRFHFLIILLPKSILPSGRIITSPPAVFFQSPQAQHAPFELSFPEFPELPDLYSAVLSCSTMEGCPEVSRWGWEFSRIYIWRNSLELGLKTS